MKKTLLGLMILSLTSCGTIVGGQKYNAHIQVVNNPNAEIVYNGTTIGTGNAMVKVKRKDANKFSFSVKQKGKEQKTYNYQSRTFRGWALVGSIFGWTGIIQGVPLPWGVAVDGINGAWWKPDINENGIIKQNYKNFKYLVSYGTEDENDGDRRVDVVYLKNGSIIKGTIIEQVPNVSLKIETRDGSVFVYKIEEIEKMTKEK